MLKARLNVKGLKKKVIYNIIISDSRNPRNGKFIEKIGFYNSHDKILKINIKRLNYWTSVGTKLTNKVKYLLKIYKKFLCIY